MEPGLHLFMSLSFVFRRAPADADLSTFLVHNFPSDRRRIFLRTSPHHPAAISLANELTSVVLSIGTPLSAHSLFTCQAAQHPYEGTLWREPPSVSRP